MTNTEIFTVDGPAVVEHFVPTTPNGEAPFVLVHGGGGQGVDWITTPDGRPGWAPLLAEKGYDVYVIDRVAHGRSPYDHDLHGPKGPEMPPEMLAGIFFPPASGEGSFPMSDLHSQWPGGRTLEDPVVQAFLATQAATLADTEKSQLLDRTAVTALLDKVGAAYVVTHSMGGPVGFLAADARPEKVLALVSLECFGPPYVGIPGLLPLRWGLANAPLTYEPPVETPSDLAVMVNESGPIPLALQLNPPKKLVELAKVPHVLVTAEASPFRWFENHLTAWLQQAGCAVTDIRLWEHGIHGNAHGFIFELNNAAILDLLLTLLPARLAA
ncbi:alpha/beta fold hydrolase [Streptomyces prasinus]